MSSSSEKLKELADQLTPLGKQNFAFIMLVFYLLNARQAAGGENDEPKPNDPDYPSMTELWEMAAKFANKLAELDPGLALQLAIRLITLPRNTDRESVHQWLRSDGPVILTTPSIKKQFLLQLSDNLNIEAIVCLQKNLKFDISDIEDAETAFSNPNAFLFVASLYFSLSLTEEEARSHPKIKSLRESAQKLILEENTQHFVKFYLEFPDTQKFAKKILQSVT